MGQRLITVLMGAPGAGKTTWLKNNKSGNEHIASTEAIRVNRDMDRGVFMAGMRIRAIRAAESGQDLIIDGTNTINSHRLLWINLAKRLNVESKLVAFNTSLPLLIQAQAIRQFPAPIKIVKEHHVRMQIALKSVHNEGWNSIEVIHRSYPQGV
jgi:predicted kinase